MSLADHHEKHFTGEETVKDVVIGMADGLTVPFALAAGISGAVAQTHLVVTAGFAEIAAGSIAMGLGGYAEETPGLGKNDLSVPSCCARPASISRYPLESTPLTPRSVPILPTLLQLMGQK